MASESAESLARQAAEQVQKVIEAAEKRAEEIVTRAEEEAERVRSRADAEARQRIERAQEAVDRLLRQADELRAAVTSLGTEVAGDGEAKAEVPAAPEIDPTPVTVPEPEPAREPEPEPPAVPEPEPPLEPEPQPPEVPEPIPPGGGRPSTEQLLEQLKGSAAKPDEAGARLVAMKMALDGKPREDVERHLAESYELPEADRLLDDVYSRVGK
ncbi:MAG: DivIVA domain-containing protein [Solirubrobacterales bacterium]